MKTTRNDRTWWTASVVFLIAVHFTVACWARHAGELRTGLKDYFLLPTERADQAIELRKEERLFSIYCLSTPLVLALAPILIQRPRWKPWVGSLVALALYLPGWWYGREMLHLSGKLIDWGRLLHEGTAESATPSPDEVAPH